MKFLKCCKNTQPNTHTNTAHVTPQHKYTCYRCDYTMNLLLVSTLARIKAGKAGSRQDWRSHYFGGKLHPSNMFVHRWSWQNGGLIHFIKWSNLFPWHHHESYFATLTHLKKNQSWKEMNRSYSWAPAWRYRRDPHDWCPFPHHYSNSHGCNWLNWAIDFIIAASLHPTN